MREWLSWYFGLVKQSAKHYLVLLVCLIAAAVIIAIIGNVLELAGLE